MGLAYGIGMRQSHPFALSFARKLKPNEPQEILNRSWTIAFFRDEKTDDIYSFTDNGTGSWKLARRARLERFKKQTEKAFRYRIFDIPLMYCFYVNRKWNLECISKEDYYTIKNCSISWPQYNDEEAEFLNEQKNRLVSDYKKALANIGIVVE